MSLYAELARLREQLRRLQECHTKLTKKQTEFFENEHLITKPDLTSTTWFGKLANTFDDIRVYGILDSFQEIESSQFGKVFTTLGEKIKEIEAAIEAVLAAIAALEAAQAAAAAAAAAKK